MRILSKSLYGKRKQVVLVHVDKPAVVKFFSPEQYRKYKMGRTHRYWGGYSETSPAEFIIPRKGQYVVAVEKGTYSHPIDVTARIEITPPKFDYMNGDPENETHSNVEVEYDDTLE